MNNNLTAATKYGNTLGEKVAQKISDLNKQATKEFAGMQYFKVNIFDAHGNDVHKAVVTFEDGLVGALSHNPKTQEDFERDFTHEMCDDRLVLKRPIGSPAFNAYVRAYFKRLCRACAYVGIEFEAVA